MNPAHAKLRPGLSKGERTKRLILERFIAKAAREGVRSLSLESLAADLGVVRSKIVYHYADIEALAAAAYAHIVSSSQTYAVRRIQGLKDTKNPKAMLYAYIAGTFDWLKKRPKSARARVALFDYIITDRKLRALNDDVLRTAHARVFALLDGVVDWPTKRRELAASAIHSALYGASVQAIVAPTLQSREDAEAMLQALVNTILA